MQKSADAFRTISEVADDLSVPQHVLRFWETRFPQIRPLKRAGGRRYYRPNDVLLLRAIRQLLYEDGYTIRGVQRLLKEQGARELGAKEWGAGTPPPGGNDVLSDRPHDPADGEFDGRLQANVPLDEPPSGERDEAMIHSGGLSPRYRSLVEDALSLVEDCKRLLDPLLREKR